MIKRTVEISREPAHLAVRHDQLLLKLGAEVRESLPCEDVGMVVVDHPQATYSHQALSRLAAHGAVVVLCGPNHLPGALVLPMAEHTQVVWRLGDQIGASLPLRKRLWQQIVRAKIVAQAQNIMPGAPSRRKLMHLARDVQSGDVGGREAQAARIYWRAWIVDSIEEYERPDPGDGPLVDHGSASLRTCASPEREVATFRRDAEGDGLNALLNYGYAIVRAAVARALVAAGLHPTLGLQHAHRGNPFCLADDLMEPLRPLVDLRALLLWRDERRELDQATKKVLLEVLTEEVVVGDDAGPLMVGLHRYAASLVRCLRREEKRLAIPRRPKAESSS